MTSPTSRTVQAQTIVVPVRTHNSANSLTHWRVTSRRRKQVREMVEMYLRMYDPLPKLPVKVSMTRCGPRKMDFDGMVNALKSVRDQVADHYGVDDGDEQFDFQYAQRKQKEYAVEILIEPAKEQKR